MDVRTGPPVGSALDDLPADGRMEPAGSDDSQAARRSVVHWAAVVADGSAPVVSHPADCLEPVKSHDFRAAP